MRIVCRTRGHIAAAIPVALVAWTCCTPILAVERPNILLVTADDLGEQLSCYGQKNIATPQLDALAAEGVRFANAYCAQSSCSSSRSSLLTGLWPHQNGQVGLANGAFLRMHPGQVTLPALLKKAGYRTGIIGKLHVWPDKGLPFDWMPAKEGMDPRPTRDVKWVAAQAREFLSGIKQSGQPFFFYVNFVDPHDPLDEQTDRINGVPEHPVSAEDTGQPLPFGAATEQARRVATAHYLNAVLRLDAGLGLLLDELRGAGCAQNTIVVYLGDNGVMLPRGKTTSYEWGVRVPLLVRWPGKAKPGQVRSELVSLIDMMPTLLEATGIPAPDNLAGLSLMPLLRGESPAFRQYLFTEMNFHMPQQFLPQRTVRDERYKLVLNLAPKGKQAPVELFDLRRDPHETANLANNAEMADTRARLASALDDWRQKTRDPLLDPARVERWKQAAEYWSKLPHPPGSVKLPDSELDRLR